MLTEEEIFEQWLKMRPYTYKYYSEHLISGFTQVISAKWFKVQPTYEQKKKANQNDVQKKSKHFFVAGRQRIEQKISGGNYNYNNTTDSYMIKSFQLKPSNQKKPQQNPQILKQINKIQYERPITCLQTINLKRNPNSKSKQNIFSQIFAIALENDSIKLIDGVEFASAQASNPLNKKQSLLNDQSPFLSKNISNIHQYSHLRSFEIGLIPIKKKIIVMKFNSFKTSLLCGCSDGYIILIDLLSTSQKFYSQFTYHKSSVKDLTWLTAPKSTRQGKKRQVDYTFASISQESYLLLWNENNPRPLNIIEGIHELSPTSVIQVRPDQLITAGKDCFIKFWDLRDKQSYTYDVGNTSITNLFNLTGRFFRVQDKLSETDPGLRFVAINQKGQIIFLQHEKEFVHLTHQQKVMSLDLLMNTDGTGLFLAADTTGKISIFWPVLGHS